MWALNVSSGNSIGNIYNSYLLHHHVAAWWHKSHQSSLQRVFRKIHLDGGIASNKKKDIWSMWNSVSSLTEHVLCLCSTHYEVVKYFNVFQPVMLELWAFSCKCKLSACIHSVLLSQAFFKIVLFSQYHPCMTYAADIQNSMSHL